MTLNALPAFLAASQLELAAILVTRHSSDRIGGEVPGALRAWKNDSR